MPGRPAAALRPFWIASAIVLPALATGGAAYAWRAGVPAAAATPIVAAFVLQAWSFLAAGFPAVREELTRRLPPARFAAWLAAASLAPFLLYSVPLGVFDWFSFGRLAALVVLASHLYVWRPAAGPRLLWQDAILLLALVSPLVGGLSDFFREIYRTPGDPVPRLDTLGKLMAISLGAFALLCLRGVERADYRFALRAQDLRIGVRWFVLSLPFTLACGLATGFVRWSPGPFDDWADGASIAGKAIGVYFATALPEELCFRGVLENLLGGRLGRPYVSRAVASLLFGAVHLGFRGFPNWPFAATAAVAGWFYGAAWRQAGGVPAAAVTHTLTVLVWTFAFQ